MNYVDRVLFEITEWCPSVVLFDSILLSHSKVINGKVVSFP